MSVLHAVITYLSSSFLFVIVNYARDIILHDFSAVRIHLFHSCILFYANALTSAGPADNKERCYSSCDSRRNELGIKRGTMMEQRDYSRADFVTRCFLTLSPFTNFPRALEDEVRKGARAGREAGSAAGDVKIGLRSGERVLRSGRSDPVNRGDCPPDRCPANKKKKRKEKNAAARAFTHASQESQGRESGCARRARGASCRATIDIVRRDISPYRLLSLSPSQIRMSGARGAVVNSRAPQLRGVARRASSSAAT